MAKSVARPLLAAATALSPALLLLSGAPSAHAASHALPAQFAAPYLQIDSSTAKDMAADQSASGLKNYTLAFLTSKSGCTLQWEDGGDSVGAFSSQINAVKSAGGNVIISFGGAGSNELAQTCTSVSSLTAAYQQVVSTYGITRLDFDIEGDTLSDGGCQPAPRPGAGRAPAGRPVGAGGLHGGGRPRRHGVRRHHAARRRAVGGREHHGGQPHDHGLRRRRERPQRRGVRRQRPPRSSSRASTAARPRRTGPGWA